MTNYRSVNDALPRCTCDLDPWYSDPNVRKHSLRPRYMPNPLCPLHGDVRDTSLMSLGELIEERALWRRILLKLANELERRAQEP